VTISSDDTARISFLGRRKYDRYDHFYPGETFDSRLLKWLGENFEKKERNVALEIIKCLKFVSTYEMKQLAARTFEEAKRIILNELTGAPIDDWQSYVAYRNVKLVEEMEKSIFVACADDISFDFFRRYAMRQYHFRKENFVEYYKRDNESLNELPKHNRIFLIDQISASGTTALRYEDGKWKGKIPTFKRIWGKHLENNSIFYCPYILSSVAETNLTERLRQFRINNPSVNILLAPTCRTSIASCVANLLGTAVDESKPVAKLCKKYYDRFTEDEHIKAGGHATYGFGSAGLTLILQSNCPNDTLYLLWHSYNDWYPLFPRVSHHTGGML
jgi:hypothetical protein